MRINWLLGLGIILGLIGASLMVAFGVLYVKPYTQVNSMKKTQCVTWNVTVTSDLVACTCASSDGRASCLSHYPCVKVWVNFTTEDGVLVTNATLYDSHNTFFLQRPAQQVINLIKVMKPFLIKQPVKCTYSFSCRFNRLLLPDFGLS